MTIIDDMLATQEAQYATIIPKGYALKLDGTLEKVPSYQLNPNTKPDTKPKSIGLLEISSKGSSRLNPNRPTPPVTKRTTTKRVGDLYQIGDSNPLVGKRMKVTWLKPWGKKPRGHVAEGTLLRTMAVNRGKTLIGELRLDNGKKLSCPWSRRYLAIESL